MNPTTDHPRIRGEHPLLFLSGVVAGGSSPHTRGARRQRGVLSGSRRIIPAYAGSTRHCSRSAPVLGDHPRIRGEHGHRLVGGVLPFGSSPHTRGALDRQKPADRGQRIIPAYAGSTSPETNTTKWPRDHPRIRGEHTWKSLQYQGSPP